MQRARSKSKSNSPRKLLGFPDVDSSLKEVFRSIHSTQEQKLREELDLKRLLRRLEVSYERWKYPSKSIESDISEETIKSVVGLFEKTQQSVERLKVVFSLI
jgi:hypothetical protein